MIKYSYNYLTNIMIFLNLKGISFIAMMNRIIFSCIFNFKW